MRKKVKILLAFMLMLGGFMMFVYPIITDTLYKRGVSIKEKEYEENISKIINGDYDDNFNDIDNGNGIINEKVNNHLPDLLNMLKDRNNKIFEEKQKTFLDKKMYDISDINLANYGLTNNIFGFIEIPSINVTLPIYLGASNSNMRKGAVHLTGTSYPVGGINTNSVIAAHRGYYKTKMFRNIDSIKLGDKLYIKNFDGILTYKAVDITIIKPDEVDKLLINEGKDMVTIISCHPYPQNKERYVVYFERV